MVRRDPDCRLCADGGRSRQFVLKSADIAPGAKITDKRVYKGFGCEGGNVSPVLEWSGALVGYMLNANALGKASFTGLYGR